MSKGFTKEQHKVMADTLTAAGNAAYWLAIRKAYGEDSWLATLAMQLDVVTEDLMELLQSSARDEYPDDPTVAGHYEKATSEFEEKHRPVINEWLAHFGVAERTPGTANYGD